MIERVPAWSPRRVCMCSFYLKLIYNSWKSIVIGPSVRSHSTPKTISHHPCWCQTRGYLGGNLPYEVWYFHSGCHISLPPPSEICTWKLEIALTKQCTASTTLWWIKLCVLPLSIKTTIGQCLIKPLILIVWGEEMPAKAWSEITGSYGVAGSWLSYWLFPSSSSGPLKDGASLDELWLVASIWKNLGSLQLCPGEYLSSQ